MLHFSLAEARKRKHFTQEGLEAASGVEQSIISRAERGLIVPETTTIAKLATALGLKAEQLLFTKKGGKA